MYNLGIRLTEGMFQANPPTTIEACSGGQGTPSPLSPTPSPAGSVGSVGSQSSGYSSGAPPALGPFVPVPPHIHRDMQRQNTHFSTLVASFELWEQADTLVYKNKLRGKTWYYYNFRFYLCTSFSLDSCIFYKKECSSNLDSIYVY